MDKLIEAIFSNKRVVVITGAGISTLSGIPDFRGKNGLYKTNENIEWFLSKNCFIEEPEKFYNFYKNNMILLNIKPNIIHNTLAKLEKAGYIECIITQNIDGLHEKAGSKKFIELHGNGERFYCSRCNEKYDINEYINDGYICKKCNGKIRPDIVLYGERVKSRDKALAYKEIIEADVVIVFGSSLTVSTVINLLNKYIDKEENFSRDKLIIVNDNETMYDDCSIKYSTDLESTFKKIKKYNKGSE